MVESDLQMKKKVFMMCFCKSESNLDDSLQTLHMYCAAPCNQEVRMFFGSCYKCVPHYKLSFFFFFLNWDGWQRKAARLCLFVGIEEVPASAAEVDIHASVGSVCVDDIEETGTSLHCAAAVNI